MGSLIYGLSRDLAKIAVDIIRQPAHCACLDFLDRPERDIGARGVGFQAAVIATLAAAPFSVDGGMPDLPGTA